MYKVCLEFEYTSGYLEQIAASTERRGQQHVPITSSFFSLFKDWEVYTGEGCGEISFCSWKLLSESKTSGRVPSSALKDFGISQQWLFSLVNRVLNPLGNTELNNSCGAGLYFAGDDQARRAGVFSSGGCFFGGGALQKGRAPSHAVKRAIKMIRTVLGIDKCREGWSWKSSSERQRRLCRESKWSMLEQRRALGLGTSEELVHNNGFKTTDPSFTWRIPACAQSHLNLDDESIQWLMNSVSETACGVGAPHL